VAPLLNADQLTVHVHASFPGGDADQRMRVEEVTGNSIRLHIRIEASSLRPNLRGWLVPAVDHAPSGADSTAHCVQ
jgi:hypothetical protein